MLCPLLIWNKKGQIVNIIPKKLKQHPEDMMDFLGFFQ